MGNTYNCRLCNECARMTLGMETRFVSHEGLKKCEFCGKKKITGIYEVKVIGKEKK